MFFYLQPIIYTLVFLLALEAVALKNDWTEVAAWFLIAFTTVVIWPLTRKPRFIALPFFLSFGALTLLFFVDHPLERQVFIFLSSFTYYLTIAGGYRLRFYNCDQTALGMVNLATAVSAFFWFTSAFAWFLNYQIQYWLMSLVLFLAVFLISLPSFFICARDRKEREKRDKSGKNSKKKNILLCCGSECLDFGSIIFIALVLSLISTQIFFGLFFWPFSYLTLGTCGFIIFYGFWDTIRVYLRGELTFQRVILNLFISIILLAGILATAQWELAV